MNYKNIIIEESAISDKDETVSFYHIKRESIGKLKKHWASGIGSFNKSHLLKHRSKRFLISEDDIEEIKNTIHKSKKELQNKTKEPAIKEIVKEKKLKKDIPLRAKNDPRQKN